MGLEPTTTGITILDSTIELQSPLAGHEGFEPPPNGFGIRDATVTPMTQLNFIYHVQQSESLVYYLLLDWPL